MRHSILQLSIFFFLIVLLAACSNDDGSDSISEDAIVGEWIAVQKFEGENEVGLSFCESRIVLSFIVDGTQVPRWTTGTMPPPQCSDLMLAPALSWESTGQNQWEMSSITGEVLLATLRIENNRLVESIPNDRESIFIYERL
ncbi:MAG: hypothetical protein AAFU57_15485 [Bacteroidota bacterium]